MVDLAGILKRELLTAAVYKTVHKDIIIVVRDQPEYVRNCINSVEKYTKDYTLWIFDNGSRHETRDWLAEKKTINLLRSEENLGFIIPNNRMAAMGKEPFLILLNSDTIVFHGWDAALIAVQQQDPEVALTGYQGGFLNELGLGGGEMYGADPDFVSGWCMCLRREVYENVGLFDEKNLEFAYCEDADLSFRIREAGYRSYALSLRLVWHKGNITVKAVASEGRNMRQTFEKNHAYLRRRWPQYLRARNVEVSTKSW